MGGIDALRGFDYQELAVLHLWLREQCTAYLGADTPPREVSRIGIEVAPGHDQEVAWDILIEYSDETVLLEAKSGTISRHDRHTFWYRARRTAASVPTRIGFVLSPSRASPLVTLLQGLPGIPSCEELPAAAPAAVSSAEDLRDEALWCLAVSSKESRTALGREEAERLIRSLVVVPASHQDLLRSCRAFLESLLPSVLTDNSLALLKDSLRSAALEKEPSASASERLLERLSAAFGVQGPEVEEAKQFLNRIQTYSRKTLERVSRGAIGIECPDDDAGYVRGLSEVCPELTSVRQGHSYGVVASAGSGKTVLLQLALAHNADGASLSSYRHLLLSPSQLPEDTAVLRRALALVSAISDVTLFVDGLDEVPDPEGTCSALAAFAQCPRSALIWSARIEVADRLPAFKPLWDSPFAKRVPVSAWPKEVVEAFLSSRLGCPEGVENRLLQVLTVPFFLRIFAELWQDGRDAASNEDLHKIQTRTGLLERYLTVRVNAETPLGRRRAGHAGLTPAAHIARKQKALDGLAQRVIQGWGSFCPDGEIDADDFEALEFEGVLRRHPIALTARFQFTHALLRDHVAARKMLHSALSDGGGVDSLYEALRGMPSGPVRDSVGGALLLLLSQPPAGAVPDPGDTARLLLRAHERRNEERDLYLGLVYSYVAQGPEIPGRSLDQWPCGLGRPPEFVEDMVAVLSSAPPDLGLRWWESATDWEPGRDVVGVEAAASLARLAESLWSDDKIPDVEVKRHAAAQHLLRASQAIQSDQLNTWGNLHITRRIAEWATEIPAQWARERCGIEVHRITAEIVTHIRKVLPEEDALDVLMSALSLERGDDERWRFKTPTLPDDYFLEHALLDKGLSDSSFVTAHAPEVLRVLAAALDALDLRHRENSRQKDTVSYLLESEETAGGDSAESEADEAPTGDLVEDLSQIWFWESDLRSDLRGKLGHKVLGTLEDLVQRSEPELFGKSVDAMFDTSKLMLLRTLAGEALYRADRARTDGEAPSWQRDQWLRSIADWRLYRSYSMTFWLRYGLRRFFSDLEPTKQERVVEIIRAIAGEPHGEGRAARYASDIADHLSAGSHPDVLQLVRDRDSILAPRHPSDNRVRSSWVESDAKADFQRSGEFEEWGVAEDEDAFVQLYELDGRLRNLAQDIRSGLRRSEGVAEEGKDDVAAQMSELKDSLRKSVPPMSDVMKNPGHAIEYAYPLGFASTILSAIISGLAPAVKDGGHEHSLSQLLGEYAPWLEQALERSGKTILTYVPEHHRGRDFFSGYGWPDTMICAFEVLDLLLLPQMPEDVRQEAEALLGAVPRVSSTWPPTTRCHFAARLRAWHWARCAEMYDTIADWMAEENRAPEISALASLAATAYHDKKPEIVRSIAVRSDLIGDRDQLDSHFLGPLLGQAWYCVSQDPENTVVRALAEQYEEVLTSAPRCPLSLLLAMATSVHRAYCDSINAGDSKPDPERYGKAMTSLYKLVMEHSDVDDEGRGRAGRTFAHLLWAAFREENCPAELAPRLWRALCPVTERILMTGDWLAVTDVLHALSRDDTAEAIPPDWGALVSTVEQAVESVSRTRLTTQEPNDLAWGWFASGRQILGIVKRYFQLRGPPKGSRTAQRLRSVLTELTAWPAKSEAIQLRQEILGTD